MMAFALVDDQAAWAELPDWHKEPDAIRRVLTRSTIPITHRLARFVGLTVYEAFGGPVIRDLFGAPDQCFLADGHLLERLATDQLTRAAFDVRQEGWSWVSIEPDVEWSLRYDRVHPQHAGDRSSSFSPEDLARAGARLSVDPDGALRIDRGLACPTTRLTSGTGASVTHSW